MKAYMKHLIFGMMATALVTSCQDGIDQGLFETDMGLPQKVSEQYVSSSEVAHNIKVDVLARRFGGFHKNGKSTRSTDDFSITPYINKGDTLLYVVQYQDGWDLYSANYASRKLLFSSEHGILNLNDSNLSSPLKEMILSEADMVREISTLRKDYVDPSWGILSTEDENFINAPTVYSNNGVSRKPQQPAEPPGEWIIISSEYLQSKFLQSPKLTETEWFQTGYYRQYSKKITNSKGELESALAGCYPIAVSQYLYYTHFAKGIPAETVSKATPTSDGKDFVFSDFSTEPWNLMVNAYFDLKLKTIAMFIGHVGREMKATYGLEETGVYDTDAINYLKKIYGVSFTLSNIDFSYIMESIDNGFPLISTAKTNKSIEGDLSKKKGHAFLIDQYKTSKIKVRHTYALKRSIGNNVAGYIPDILDENGNVIEYAYTKIVETEEYDMPGIRMNWGFNGDDNEVWHYISNISWEAGGYYFNNDRKILKRSDIKLK